MQYHRNNYMLSYVVHIKTRLVLLGIQTLRWDQRLQLQNFFMTLVLFFVFASRLYIVINVSVQYNGGFLPEIILLTLCDNIGEPF